jgi:exodeoxyribonuclease V beta subunit
METEQFSAESTRLVPGISLIEASAGTGKTYAIAMLALRFVVEHNFDIKSLLVVTFTKAATEELKARIRSRLTEARQHLDHADNKGDATLHHWLLGLELPHEEIRQRLDQALLDLDQAGIFTIHGFCQRVLAEHALESGQLFDSELTGDISMIRQGCADDFWRQVVYPLSPWEASVVCGEYQTPDALLSSVNNIDPMQTVYPDCMDNSLLLAQLNQEVNQLAADFDVILDRIRLATESGKFKDTYVAKLPGNSEDYVNWLKRITFLLPDFSLMSSAGLMEGLNGSKFRKSLKNPLTPEQQKTQFINELDINSQLVDELLQTIAQLQLNLRRSLLHALNEKMAQTMQQLNLLSFDDLITRLADAVQGDKSQLLIAELQQRFRVALIDEFQDTDSKQWKIFSSLFSAQDQYLYLIGDPKQAIYKFRGADIYSYFAARDNARQQYTLGKNWRSHPALVDGINRLFKTKQPFYSAQLDFLPVSAARTEQQGELTVNDKVLPPLVLWQLEAKPEKEFWSVMDSSKVKQAVCDGVVNEIVELLNKPYEIKAGQNKCRLQPRDIAILVRTNPQAKQYQQALSAVAVPSVLNSKESVFASVQARELYEVLQAIAQPGQIALLKQALTLDWFGLDGQQLYALTENEVALDSWIMRLHDYLHIWQQQGLMSMIQQMFEQEQVTERIARQPQAERSLTNLNHLTELLQQAAIDEHLGVGKSLEWLQQAITQSAEGQIMSSDEQQLRLESDEDAVRIITMHSAKGLEYPVVFCPSVWQRDTRLQQEKKRVICHEEGDMVVDLGSPQFSLRHKQALEEELAEDLRLLYVALTRAKYRCYINWADVRTGQKANDSALAYLLGLGKVDFAEQQAFFQQLCREQPNVFTYCQLAYENFNREVYQRESCLQLLQQLKQQRQLSTHWQMSSYTALSALSVHEEPELPEDKADEQEVNEPVATVAAQLPKGAHTGNVLHDLLERLSFTDITSQGDIALQRDNACTQYGLRLEQPELIDQLLVNVVNTPLADDKYFCLKNIADQQCLKEMPFYLSMQSIDVARINVALADCPTVQVLEKRQMSGFLTGFIDLICCYQGRYYVMDYKSNYLQSYDNDHLIHAMREHNYGLQYWLYTLVLHRYLQQRLVNYDYATHVGGVKYLFMRGMCPEKPGSGVFCDKPDLTTLTRLETLFF